MLFDYSRGDMEDIRFNENISYELTNLGFVKVTRNKDFVFSYKNGKPSYSFIFVEQGALEYYFIDAKKKVVIEKGELLFIPKLLPYTTTYLCDSTRIKILTFDIGSSSFSSIFAKYILKKSSTIEQIFHSFNSSNLYNSLFLASKIYELLYILNNELSSIPQKYKKLAPAIEELQKLYFNNNKIDYYAKLCGMSESNFRKLFREFTGKSPIEYRNAIRISMVKKFLDSGEFTVAEAAYLAGFNNMAFFYKIYRK